MARRFLAIGSICLAGFLAAPAAISQGQPEPGSTQPAVRPEPGRGGRIAVLDVVRIFNECAQIKDLNERMRQKTEDFQSEIKRRDKELQNRDEELSAFRPGTPDYENRRKQLLNLTIEARTWMEQTEADLERQKYDWTTVIYEQTMIRAADVAKARGFDIVLQRTDFNPREMDRKLQNLQTLRTNIQDRVVIFHIADVDITDDVIRALDAAYRESMKATTTRPPPMGPGTPTATQPQGPGQPKG